MQEPIGAPASAARSTRADNPTLLEKEPAARPTVLETFAVNGGMPSVTKVENVTRVPAPDDGVDCRQQPAPRPALQPPPRYVMGRPAQHGPGTRSS